MDCIIVTNPEEATHWIPTYDSRYKNDSATLNQPYKLFKSLDGEISLIDDDGNDINLWLAHKGYFVKEIELN